MTESFPLARREALQGIVEAARVLASRSVADGEPLEDVVVLLDTVVHILEEQSP
jgi:hypothetical protein